MRGASRGVLEVGQVRRPRACLASTHSGGPWVAVRPHYGGLPLMAGRGTDEGRRKLPGSGRAQPSRPRPEVTAPGTEIAAMERRVASAPAQGAPTPPGVRTDGRATRRSIPLARMSGLPDAQIK